jgi:hypothetical protein
MFIRVVVLSIWLTGPFAFLLLVGLYLGRRVCPKARLLDEVSEPMVIVAASVLALAVAGLIVPALNPLGG